MDNERAMVQLKKSFEACFARRMEAVINAKEAILNLTNKIPQQPRFLLVCSAYCFLISVSNKIIDRKREKIVYFFLKLLL